MKPPRPPRRSSSPFGTIETVEALPFASFDALFGTPPEGIKPPRELSTPEHLPFLAGALRKIWDAPAHDAPKLSALCAYIIRQTPLIEEKGAAEAVWTAMNELFDRKTELFLIDHQDKAHLEKIQVAGEYRDIVLFSKERDALVGQFFAPATERQPGKFSEFVHRWTETENPDQLIHFIDFCAGSKNPTFEYYLLFSHPALNRIVNNKTLLRGFFERTQAVLSKLASPTWEADTRKALGL